MGPLRASLHQPKETNMTNALTPYYFDFNGHQLRAFNIDGQPWLVAKDVCDALSLSNSRKAIASLDDAEIKVTTGYSIRQDAGNPSADEKGVCTADTPRQRGNPRNLMVNESGLYALIFKSRKPEAKAFRLWVTSIVLPAIRKDGMYIDGEEHATTEEDFVALAQRAFDGVAAKVDRLQAQVRERDCQLSEQASKIADYDTRWSRNDSIGLTEYARQAGLRPNKFTETLREMGYLFNRKGTRNMPYAHHLDTLFIRKETTAGFPQTFLTPVGCEHFNTMIADGSFDAVKAA